MKYCQWVCTVILMVFVSACSSTNKIQYSDVKRPLTSDFALAMSLLERPIPEDQQMMLAFAKQQEQQWGYMHYVAILGDKSSSPAKPNMSPFYSQVSHDNNAVSIKAPTKL